MPPAVPLLLLLSLGWAHLSCSCESLVFRRPNARPDVLSFNPISCLARFEEISMINCWVLSNWVFIFQIFSSIYFLRYTFKKHNLRDHIEIVTKYWSLITQYLLKSKYRFLIGCSVYFKIRAIRWLLCMQWPMNRLFLRDSVKWFEYFLKSVIFWVKEQIQYFAVPLVAPSFPRDKMDYNF